MGKSKKYKFQKIWTGNDYALRHSNQQRSPSEETVRVLTMQIGNVHEQPSSFKKKPEDDEITKYPEITQNYDDPDGRNKQKKKPIACLECVKPIQILTRKEIKRGDHIKFHGRIYDHHAIVVDVKPSNEKDHKAVVELVHASNTTAGAIYCCFRPFGSKAKLLSETKRINFKR
ncbi:unnamed protein product [Mytilus coruscus]|uniref:Uncharacterized protein n=1 Tax=Mytilus coruscus TaxID=42192 RepID=A0A6J8D9C1_MYTCO|nr:unnamed protein product [Mytilus coruscus]